MKTIFALAALLTFVSVPEAWSQLTQWPTAQGGNDHFYEVVPALGGISWSNASAAATNRGGYLATIASSNENEFIFGLASQNTNIWYVGYGPWLGGIQPAGSAEPNGGWSWITGETFTFQSWAPSQPNNNGGAENRIHYGGLPTNSSAWNDLGQNDTNYSRGYVVEYVQHPNVVTLHIAKVNGHVILSWASRTNVQYTIKYTDELTNASWNTFATVNGNGITNGYADAHDNPRRFYRVSAPQ